MPKKKVYAVAVGRQPGIYNTWEETQAQISGYPGATHKSFATREEADEFVRRFLGATEVAVAPQAKVTGVAASVKSATTGSVPEGRDVKKFYAVAVGHRQGIYEDWAACAAQVKGFPGCIYQSFRSRVEAEEFLQDQAAANAKLVGEIMNPATNKSSFMSDFWESYDAPAKHQSPSQAPSQDSLQGRGKKSDAGYSPQTTLDDDANKLSYAAPKGPLVKESDKHMSDRCRSSGA